MAVDGDETLLPTPPPPRPAARRAAVEAALRKFDGSEEALPESSAPRRPTRSWWTNLGRRPAGALVTAALIAVIGVPAAMIALRDQNIAPRTQEPAPPQSEQNSVADKVTGTNAMQAETAAPVEAVEPPEPSQPSVPEPLSLAPSAKPTIQADAMNGLDAAPMAAPVAAAPPPPPPPPPAPPAAAPQVAGEAETQDIVLTGSRVAQPSLRKKNENRERAASAASPLAVIDANGEFLSRLQRAVTASDKRAILSLVGLPLRVNFDSGPKTYNDRRSVERDFDLIFTPHVRQAILDQRANQLFTNYQGAMIGAGEIWFDEGCANSSCSRRGPVRIRAINP